MNKDKKKVFIRSFGCQMNVRDSEFVMGLMLENGFRQASSFEDANVILFNSCSVRKHAEDRLFSNISDLKRLKEKRPSLVIGLMGCTAQNYKAALLDRMPLIDIVCGPGNESDLPALIKDVLEHKCPIVATDKVDASRPETVPEFRKGSFKAYVSISEGCDNFCSYCIVPYVRGRERSRDAKTIVKEIEGLAKRGFKEITLLGQNVNSYRSKDGVNGFARLLDKANKIKGIRRIRFMTSHPKDATTELFRAMKDMQNVCEHLHLPLQSGSDKVLRLMNRGYTAKKYLKLVEDYRKTVPGGSITTDIIVGFPSEGDDDFQKTLDMVKGIGFDSTFIFKYSPRPPAKSARLEDDVPGDVKQERLKTLLDIQCALSQTRNSEMLDKAVEILVDGLNEKEPSKLVGRTRTNKTAVFEGDRTVVGKLADVKITSVTPHALRGEMVRYGKNDP